MVVVVGKALLREFRGWARVVFGPLVLGLVLVVVERVSTGEWLSLIWLSLFL